MGDAGKPTDWITMKIDPEIFEELGVRDPEETKREMAITKKTRQVSKELKADPDNLDLQIEQYHCLAVRRWYERRTRCDAETKMLRCLTSRFA